MKTHRFLPITAAFAALSLAVTLTGQSQNPQGSNSPDQPRFNRPDNQSSVQQSPRTDARANPADPAASPATRPGTSAEIDARNAGTTGTDRRAAGAKELSRADRNFFEKAAKSGQKELVVSQTVLSQLSAPGAREFAEMMVREHTAANEELMALAQRKGVDMSDVHESRDQERLTRRWSDKNDDLNEDYLKEMVKDHEDAVELYEKAAKSEDPEIAAFAQKTLPKLQHHLEMARTQHKSVEDQR